VRLFLFDRWLDRFRWHAERVADFWRGEASARDPAPRTKMPADYYASDQPAVQFAHRQRTGH
jgi:hypothetical protein